MRCSLYAYLPFRFLVFLSFGKRKRKRKVFASVDGIGAPCQSYRTHGFLWEAGSPHLASPNVAVWLLLKSLHLRQQVVFSRKRRPKFLRSNRTNPGLATLARLRPAHVHAWIRNNFGS